MSAALLNSYFEDTDGISVIGISLATSYLDLASVLIVHVNFSPQLTSCISLQWFRSAKGPAQDMIYHSPIKTDRLPGSGPLC